MAGASAGNARVRSLAGRPTSPLVAQCSAMRPSTSTLGAPGGADPPPLLAPLPPLPLGAPPPPPLASAIAPGAPPAAAEARRRSATAGQEPRKVSIARVRGLTSHSGSEVPVSCCGRTGLGQG
jgi:hypothetical protein